MRYIAVILCGFSAVIFAQLDYDAGLQQGRITYYDQVTIGACDIPESARPAYTCALNEDAFQGGLACGATARLVLNDNDTIILQQGVNGYNGCFDTYAASYIIVDTLNLGSSEVLKINYLDC